MGYLRVSTPPLTYNGGKASTNLWFVDGTVDNITIDRIKQSNAFVVSGAVDTNWPSRLDDNGYPQSMPAGGGQWTISEFYIYGTGGDVWVLDWAGGGAATLTMVPQSGAWTGGNLSAPTVISSTELRYTITGTPLSSTVPAVAGGPLKAVITITAMTAPFTSIRCYRLSDQSRLANTDATGIFTPEFLARSKCGMMRAMDANTCNNSRLYEWAYRRKLTHVSWSARHFAGSWFYGTPTVSLNRYTVNSMGTLTNGKPVHFWLPGRPIFKTVAAATLTNPLQLKVYGHGFSGGEKIICPGGQDGSGGSANAWLTAFSLKTTATGMPPDYAVSVVDANTVTLPFDATAGAGFTAANVNITYTLSAGVVGTFSVGETVTGGTSGATGTVVSFSGTSLVLNATVGNFTIGETMTGGTSAAHGVLSSLFANFALMPEFQISDGTNTKRVLRPGLINHSSTEWGTWASGGIVTAVYDATFDVFILAGDFGTDFLIGFPPEAMISFANYQKCHLHQCFPLTCSADFWTQLATLTKATLASYLQFWTETGNEVWNTAFVQTLYATALAAVRYATPPGNPSITAYDLGYAGRFVEVSDAIKTIYGSSTNWKMILGCQQGSLNDNRLMGNATIQGGLGSNGYPANKADYISVAPYTSLMWQASSPNPNTYPGLLDQIDNFKQGGSLAQTAFDWMKAELIWPSTPGYGSSQGSQQLGTDNTQGRRANIVAQIATVTSKGYIGRTGLGLRQTNYEGGPLQTSGNLRNNAAAVVIAGTAPISGHAIVDGDFQAYWLGFLASAQGGAFITLHLAGIASAGAEFPNIYALAAPWTAPVNFGMQQTNAFNAATTPMLTAFKAWDGAI